MQFFPAILSALALAVLTTSATPIDSDEDEGPIIGPPEVLEPEAGDTWVVGTQQLVGWGAAVEADLIEDPTLYTGTIVLGFEDGKTSSENLDTSKPPPPRPVAPPLFTVVAGKSTLHATPSRRKPARARR